MGDELDPGTELPGGYVIEELLGSGRVTARYRARGTDGTAACAHIVHLALGELLGEWFLQNAIAHRGFEHPVLPRTLAVGELDGPRPVEVTELLVGRSARAWLEVSPQGLEPITVATIVTEVASALDYLHAQRPPYLHRALSPERVFILDDTHEIRLLGVGVADRPQFSAVRAGQRSPEELAGVSGLTPRADVFSLASLAWELLTNRPAFTGLDGAVLDAMRVGPQHRVSALRPGLSPAVDTVLLDAWALSPERRPHSAGRFAELFSIAIEASSLSTDRANTFDDRPTTETPVLLLSGRANTLIGSGTPSTPSPLVSQAIAPIENTSPSRPPDSPSQPTPAATDSVSSESIFTDQNPSEPTAPTEIPVTPAEPIVSTATELPSQEPTAPTELSVTPADIVSTATELPSQEPTAPHPTPKEPKPSAPSLRPSGRARADRRAVTPALHLPLPDAVALSAQSSAAPGSSLPPPPEPARVSVPSIVIAAEVREAHREPSPSAHSTNATPSVTETPADVTTPIATHTPTVQPAPSQPSITVSPVVSPVVSPTISPIAVDPDATEVFAVPPREDSEDSEGPHGEAPMGRDRRGVFAAVVLLANAVVIVGIAHAIAWGYAQRPAPVVTLAAPSPSPVCPACPVCPVAASEGTPTVLPEVLPTVPLPEFSRRNSRATTDATPRHHAPETSPEGAHTARPRRRSRIIVTPPSF